MSRCLFLAVASCLLFAGCSTFDLAEQMPWSKSEAEEPESKYPAPETMIAIWTETIYSAPGQPPMRGFGGRLFFYDKNSRPVPVDGELICYGFDDSTDANSSTPDRKFVFTREQLTQHYGETDIGASYSIWLPWDQLGNPKKQISLYPVFKSANGKLVRAQTSKHVLPGKEGLLDQKRAGLVERRQGPRNNWFTDNRVQPVSHDQHSSAGQVQPGPQGAAAGQGTLPSGQKAEPRRTSTFRMPSALRDAQQQSKQRLSQRAAAARAAADEMLKEYRDSRLQQMQQQFQTSSQAANSNGSSPAQANGQSVSTGQLSPQFDRAALNRNAGFHSQAPRSSQGQTVQPASASNASQPRLPRSSTGAVIAPRSRVTVGRSTSARPVVPRGPQQPQGGFQPGGHPAQTTPASPQYYGHVPSQPHPQAPRFGQP